MDNLFFPYEKTEFFSFYWHEYVREFRLFPSHQQKNWKIIEEEGFYYYLDTCQSPHEPLPPFQVGYMCFWVYFFFQEKNWVLSIQKKKDTIVFFFFSGRGQFSFPRKTEVNSLRKTKTIFLFFRIFPHKKEPVFFLEEKSEVLYFHEIGRTVFTFLTERKKLLFLQGKSERWLFRFSNEEHVSRSSRSGPICLAFFQFLTQKMEGMIFFSKAIGLRVAKIDVW